MSYIVTDKGPIDRHEPGTDVTGLYPADVLRRLMKDGYVKEKGATWPPAKARKPKSL